MVTIGLTNGNRIIRGASVIIDGSWHLEDNVFVLDHEIGFLVPKGETCDGWVVNIPVIGSNSSKLPDGKVKGAALIKLTPRITLREW